MTRQQPGNRQESKPIEPRRTRQPSRPLRWQIPSPFGMMRHLADEMDRMFENVGTPERTGRFTSWTEPAEFLPDVDVVQIDGKLIVRADLPGMTKDDVNVDITPNSVRIEGERRYEHETNQEGIFRSERNYGSFCREIPLPDGVTTDNATAKFKDGVLEVTMDASQIMQNRRRIQIQEETDSRPGKSAA